MNSCDPEQAWVIEKSNGNDYRNNYLMGNGPLDFFLILKINANCPLDEG